MATTAAPAATDGAGQGGGAAIDAVDAPAAGDAAAPVAPAAPAPDAQPPTSDAEPGDAPSWPGGRSPDSRNAEPGAALDGLSAGSTGVRLETDGDHRGGSAAGLVAAGAILVLGQKVLTRRGLRRRPLTAAFRPGDH
jgi:hypothetical protein